MKEQLALGNEHEGAKGEEPRSLLGEIALHNPLPFCPHSRTEHEEHGEKSGHAQHGQPRNTTVFSVNKDEVPQRHAHMAMPECISA